MRFVADMKLVWSGRVFLVKVRGCLLSMKSLQGVFFRSKVFSRAKSGQLITFERQGKDNQGKDYQNWILLSFDCPFVLCHWH